LLPRRPISCPAQPYAPHRALPWPYGHRHREKVRARRGHLHAPLDSPPAAFERVVGNSGAPIGGVSTCSNRERARALLLLACLAPHHGCHPSSHASLVIRPLTRLRSRPRAAAAMVTSQRSMARIEAAAEDPADQTVREIVTIRIQRHAVHAFVFLRARPLRDGACAVSQRALPSRSSSSVHVFR